MQRKTACILASFAVLAVSSATALQQVYPGGRPCGEPLSHGPCPEGQYTTKWRFDANERRCKQATFCQSKTTGNVFNSFHDCHNTCGDYKGPPNDDYRALDYSRCGMPMPNVECFEINDANSVKWGYNVDTERCEKAYYCYDQEEGNVFTSEAKCNATCLGYTRLRIEFYDRNRCGYPIITSTVSRPGQWTKKYVYNMTSSQCVIRYTNEENTFGNIFPSLQDCMNTCFGYDGPTFTYESFSSVGEPLPSQPAWRPWKYGLQDRLRCGYPKNEKFCTVWDVNYGVSTRTYNIEKKQCETGPQCHGGAHANVFVPGETCDKVCAGYDGPMAKPFTRRRCVCGEPMAQLEPCDPLDKVVRWTNDKTKNKCHQVSVCKNQTGNIFETELECHNTCSTYQQKSCTEIQKLPVVF